MFDLGWGELMVVGVVALVVLGPKELPNALRTVTNLTKTARKLAGEFQSGTNEIVREAELEDARKVAQSISKNSISKTIEKAIDPTGEMKSTVSGIEKDVKGVSAASPLGPIPPSPIVAPTSPAAPAVAGPEAPSGETSQPAPRVDEEAKA